MKFLLRTCSIGCPPKTLKIVLCQKTNLNFNIYTIYSFLKIMRFGSVEFLKENEKQQSRDHF